VAPLWLLSAALRGALVAALALTALGLLRRSSASLRHGVLVLALGALALLPLASSVLPAWRVALGPWSEAVGGLVVDESTRPIAEATAPPRVASPAAPAAAVGVGGVARGANPLSLRGRALTLLWAAGVLVGLARLAGAQAKARAIVRRARPLDDAAWAREVARAARLVSIRGPRVLVSDEVEGPAVTGLVRPTLLLPAGALAWGQALRQAVLLHEFAHLRRGDIATTLLAEFVRALHWFDPLVWVAVRRLHHERELAADSFALRAGALPSSYAESLLAVAGAGRSPGAVLAMAQRPLLSRRIEAVLGPRAGAAAGPLARVVLLSLGPPVAAVLACASPDATSVRRASSAVAGPAPSPRVGEAARAGSRLEAVARSLGVATGQVELTLDGALQRAAEEEVERLVSEHSPTALSVVIMTPSDGAVVALAGRSPRAGEEAALEREYVPGSTVKVVTLAAAFEEGKLRPSDRIAYEGREHGLPELLATSSNTGTTAIYRRIGDERLGRWLRRFHFGEAPSADALPLPAAAGALPDGSEGGYDPALAAIGAGLSASALQVAAAYSALANGGVYNAPALVRRVRDEGGRVTWEHRPSAERLVAPETARTLLGLLAAVVESPKGTGQAARVEGARVGGKTGTIEPRDDREGRASYASFVGVAPLESPRYVIAVGIEGVAGSGGRLAAPSFARLAAKALSEIGAR
jgi:beta-lactamase regulating signal transducer with metallopeptidase domain